MAVFFTVQFGSQPHGMYKPAKQKAKKRLPGKHYDTKSYLCPKKPAPFTQAKSQCLTLTLVH